MGIEGADNITVLISQEPCIAYGELVYLSFTVPFLVVPFSLPLILDCNLASILLPKLQVIFQKHSRLLIEPSGVVPLCQT
jgi:hypothetical protein